MDLGIPPLKRKNLTEQKFLEFQILSLWIGRSGIWGQAEGGQQTDAIRYLRRAVQTV